MDNLIEGRLLLHIITGGVDADQRRDGDYTPHDERYRRTDEYLEVMRMVWNATEPFDFEGAFYRVSRASSDVQGHQKPHVPLWFGGVSDAAIPVGAKHCDTYALFGEPRAQVQELMPKPPYTSASLPTIYPSGRLLARQNKRRGVRLRTS